MGKQNRNNKSKNGRPQCTDVQLTELNHKLESFNLYVKVIESDGNCMFRAIADQLEQNGYNNAGTSSSSTAAEDAGREGKIIKTDTESACKVSKTAKEKPRHPKKITALSHVDVRSKCVEYMRDNSDFFKLFIDEDEDGEWSHYLDNMEQDSTWGGQLELMAITKVLEIHIILFQAGMGTLEMRFDEDLSLKDREQGEDRPVCLIAYVGGDHYNSIRMDASSVQKLISKGSDSSLTLRKLKNDIYGEAAWKKMLALESTEPTQSVKDLVKEDAHYKSFIEQLNDCLPEEKKTEILSRETFLIDIFRRVVWDDENVGDPNPVDSSRPTTSKLSDDRSSTKDKKALKNQTKNKKKTPSKSQVKNGKDTIGEIGSLSSGGSATLRKPKFDKETLTKDERTSILRERVDNALEKVLGGCMS